jgi:hypothetical protein
MAQKRKSKRAVAGIKPNQDPVERQIAVDQHLARTRPGRKVLEQKRQRAAKGE